MKQKLFEVGIRKNTTSLESLQIQLSALIQPSGRFLDLSLASSEDATNDVVLIRFQIPESSLPGILKDMLELGIELCYLSNRESTLESLPEKGSATDLQDANYIRQLEKAMQEVSTLQHELLEALMKTPAHTRKINLPSMRGFQRFDVSTVIRCESEDNYTHIFFTNRKKITVSKTLQEFEQRLSDAGFFRVHHKHLINTEHIVEYRKGKGGQVIMSDQSTIDVSARKKSDFMRYINDLSQQSDTY